MTAETLHRVRVQLDGALATVTVGTGRRRNALGTPGWRDLADAFDALSREPGLAAVLVQGTGNTFCAGSDVTEWRGATPEAVEESFARMETAFRAIEACPVPVVAQIAGYAAGAGCQLALACDLRVIGTTGRIGMPIARLGIRASPAFAARLARLAGPAVAAELLYTGRLLNAEQAVATGLANLAVPSHELPARTHELLAEILRHPPSAVRAAKQALTAAGPTPPRNRLGPAVDYADLQRGITDLVGPEYPDPPSPGAGDQAG